MFPFSKHAPVISVQHLPGLSRPVSRLVLGTDHAHKNPDWEKVADAFIERGGNCLDTAHIYGSGQAEEAVGKWIHDRGLKDELILIVKGAHTPNCNPHSISTQLTESLRRLRVERAPIYIMHRDNHEVPVEEFVDVLDQLSRTGLVGIYGGSNWSFERVDQANAYAQRRGRKGFRVVSNQFSLAEMVEPVWAGCILASDPDSRAWLVEKQIPNFAWSSQARGFFTDRAAPDKKEDEMLVRCWYSERNFERKRRAAELAKIHGVDEINIALAYVLSQQFPSFCLVGPQTIDEFNSTLGGLRVNLSQRECHWLNLLVDEL